MVPSTPTFGYSDSWSAGGDPSELERSLRATAHHVGLLHERELRLAQARDEAQRQMFHRIGSAHRCGEISDRELIAIHKCVHAAAVPGSRKHWDANIDVSWLKMRFLEGKLPNGPEGSWVGLNPCGSKEPAPTQGVAVVYVLFGPDNEPCYVGSTDNFRQRIKAHVQDGKDFASWQAHPCRDRWHAYEVEDRVLRQHMPYLNRRAGR